MERVKANIGQLKTIAAGNLPAVVDGTSGVDISSWSGLNTFFPTRAVVYLYGTAATLTAATLYGYRHGRWHAIGLLNGGEDITIGSTTIGFAQAVDIIGVFSRLAVVAGGAASITQQFEPLVVTS